MKVELLYFDSCPAMPICASAFPAYSNQAGMVAEIGARLLHVDAVRFMAFLY